MQKKLKVFSVLAVLALTILNTGVSQAQSKTTIRFGFVADVTGIGYVFYQSQIAGLRIALDQINASGGILGKQVDYEESDSQLKPDVGATIARQMILQDHVDFLLGPTSSGVALAVSQVAKENKVVVAYHTANSVALTTTQFNPYIVQLVPNTTIEARAAAMLAAKLPYTKWAFIGPDYAFGHDSFNAFKPMLTQQNSKAQINNVQWPKLGERDLNPFITALQSGNPEAIYSNLWGSDLVTFVQQAQPLGVFDNTAFVGLFDTDALKLLGADAPTGKIYGYARAPFYAISNPAMDKFVASYKTLTGQYPSDWAIMMYDSVMTLKAAAEKAGSTNGDAVSKALDNLAVDSLRGPLTIRACDHMANVGEYVGTLGKDPKYPAFSVLANISYIPAESVWNTCDEIAQMRSAAAATAAPTQAATAPSK
ncbi:MAG: ABC transporter substrate-binding protein [Aggregatilineales bacterium]